MTRHIDRTTTERARPHARGFSLIELMVAVTIGLLIIAGIVSAYSSHTSAGSTNARFAELQTNGRYAIDFLRRELRHGGFLGLSSTNLKKAGSTGTTDYGCGAGFVTRIEQPIWGANDSNPLSCIPSADYERGDVLVLRRAALQPFTGTPAANTLYVRTEFLQGTVYVGPTPPNGLQPPWEDYALQADVYYISPYTTSATESPKVPALYRRTLGAGPALTPQLVASGIENMQIQYGIQATDATGTTLRFLNASQVDAADWDNVTAVRVWLLARSSDAEPGYSNTSTYTMGDQTVTVADGIPRQVFPVVVELRR
jgi:type IV pilus assembly protein PilW